MFQANSRHLITGEHVAPRSPGLFEEAHGHQGLGYDSFQEISRVPLVRALLGCSGDLVSLLSNGPCRAHYGLLWWLVGDTKWSY